MSYFNKCPISIKVIHLELLDCILSFVHLFFSSNSGPDNAWNSSISDVSQPPAADFSRHFSQHRGLFYGNSNKLLTHLPPALPVQHLFFNCQQQQNVDSSFNNAYNYFSEQQQQYPSVSSLQAQQEVTENNASSQWAFPAWAKLKPRSEEILQKPKSSTMGVLSQKPRKKHAKDSGLVQPQAVEDSKAVGHGYDGRDKALAHNAYVSLEQSATVKLNKPETSYQAMDLSDRIPSSASFDPVKQGFQFPMLDQNTSILQPLESIAQGSHIPPKKKRKRRDKNSPPKKRIRVEDKWIKNVRKNARSKGESYTSVRGKMVPARSVKPVDCSKCKFNCPSRVSEEERLRLFGHYWGLETYKDKVNYLCSFIHEFSPLRPMSGRRSYSRRYTLNVNGKDERVCKDFFLSTFDISQSTIMTFMAKKRRGPTAVADLRGKQKSSNKTPESVVRNIREHILSQTGLQGGLVRSSPPEETQNVQKLYNHYQAECQAEDIKVASISMYRKVLADMCKGKNQVFAFDLQEEWNRHPGSKTKPQLETSSGGVPISPDEEDSSALPTYYEIDSGLGSAQPTCFLPPGSDCLAGAVHNSSFQGAVPGKDVVISGHHSSKKLHGQTSHPHDTDLWGKACSNIDTSYHSYNSQTSSRNFDPIALKFPNENSDFVARPFKQMPFKYPSLKGIELPSLSSSPSTSILYSTVLTSNALPTQGLSAEAMNSHRMITENTNDTFNSGSPKKIVGNGGTNKLKKRTKEKSQKSPSKRTRNEESWERNVRKRLRLKGEAYKSVRGKQVGAKVVKKVDCSKCKFMCSSKISEDQRLALNKQYWDLDSYEKKIGFLVKHVETYTPKRKITGRKAFSRRYMFEVNKVGVRVCKDFFQSTLHISESTISTALEKTRNGTDALVDMRGRHRPGNKTPEETLQDIRELIIYLTGLRPHKLANNKKLKLKPEFCDVTHLYKIYKYDCEKKERKPASIGIFRGVLTKDFCIKKVNLIEKSDNEIKECSDTGARDLSGANDGLSEQAHTKHLLESEVRASSLPVTVPQFIQV